MGKELCFNIENDSLYLEQILVEYSEIPIYFLCKGNKSYYLALCSDIEYYNYIVVKLSIFDVYDLLHGNVSMRGAIVNRREYWEVISGEEMSSDLVTKRKMEEIDENLLPEKDAYFKILTPSVEEYACIVDKLVLQNNKISINGLSLDSEAVINSNGDMCDFTYKFKVSAYKAYFEKMDYLDDLSYKGDDLYSYAETSISNNICSAA